MPDRERLGQVVRSAWVKWATSEPDPPADWLVPWELLDERYREVDRQIGEAAAAEGQAELVRWLRAERQHMEARSAEGDPEHDDRIRAMRRANQAATGTAITSVLAMLAVYRPEIPHA